MKQYTIVIIVFMISFLFSCFGEATYGQEELTEYPTDEASYAYDAVEYSSGTVQAISPTQIMLREYDYETDADADVSYIIDTNVKLENVDSISDIAVGDIADIDYIMRDGRRVAKHIFVEKLFDAGEGEMLPPLEEPGIDEGLPLGSPPELEPPPEPVLEEGSPEELPY
jgi:hypothetical protein